MFSRQRLSSLLTLAFALFGGCSTNGPDHEAKQDVNPRPDMKRNPIEEKAEKAAPVHAGIEVSPDAKAQIAKVASTNRRIRVRLDFAAVGTSHLTTNLTIESEILGPQDVFESCGEIDFVFLREHFPLAQGAMIDWKEAENGFAVSFPNKTNENKEKSAYWMWQESERRFKQQCEEDRANGRLTQRIIDFRKLTANDPDNELGHFRLGQFLAADGQTTEAVKSFERTLAISPDFPSAYRYLGECLIKLNRKERAVQVLTKGFAVAENRNEEYPRISCRAPTTQANQPLARTGG